MHKTLKSVGMKTRKKVGIPFYTEVQMKTVKSNCHWMVKNFKSKSFVLNDESYFSLSQLRIPGNEIYYLSNQNYSPNIKLV